MIDKSKEHLIHVTEALADFCRKEYNCTIKIDWINDDVGNLYINKKLIKKEQPYVCIYYGVVWFHWDMMHKYSKD